MSTICKGIFFMLFKGPFSRFRIWSAQPPKYQNECLPRAYLERFTKEAGIVLTYQCYEVSIG